MSDINLKIENGKVDNLPPVDIPPEEFEFTDGSSQTPKEDVREEPIEIVSAEQVKSLLRWAYKAGEWRTGYVDIWEVSDSELEEIASRIAPDINRVPLLAKAVAETDQKSGWLLLVYSLASRSLRSIRRKREEAEKQEEEQSNGDANPFPRVVGSSPAQF